MNNRLLGFLAETSLHPGSGQNTGAIDLPVQREAATDYPVIVGSSLKGALRDWARKQWANEETSYRLAKVFGAPDRAGEIGISDARLLLLPIRSLRHAFVWITCPNLLERFQRDVRLMGYPIDFSIPHPGPSEALTLESGGESVLFLEELSFMPKENGALRQIASAIKPLLFHETTQNRLDSQLFVISEERFGHFARYGLPVVARNDLNEDTKASQNLWYEETLPSNTVLYSLALTRSSDGEAIEVMENALKDNPYVQVGGNETVGQGWCAVSVWKGEAQ